MPIVVVDPSALAPELLVPCASLCQDHRFNASTLAAGSSNLILQHDGMLWITQCVFQGRSYSSRAIDMNTNALGIPLLYVSSTFFPAPFRAFEIQFVSPVPQGYKEHISGISTCAIAGEMPFCSTARCPQQLSLE